MTWRVHSREIAALDLLAQFRPDVDPTSFYWLSADRQLELVAEGEVAAVEATGPDRLLRAAGRAAELWRSVELEPGAPAGTGPRLVGGFGFWDDAAPDTDWRGFPPLRFWLPRVTWLRIGERCFKSEIGPLPERSDRARARCRRRRTDASGFSASAAPSQAEFAELVARATTAIETGALEKVVLARACTLLQQGGFDPVGVLGALRDAQRGCTVYGIGLGGACFVGASPERLLRRDGDEVRADALAGSAARGRNPDEDACRGRSLFESAKERGEHAIVRRAVLAALAPLCTELEAGETPTLRRLEGIQHLHTPVRGRLAPPPPTALELAARLFPTPAVGGEPRAAALDFLRHHEDARRGWYSGGIGWLTPAGDGELCVALRSALLRGDAATLHAGVGIVAGSTPDAELEETRWKLASALGALVDL